MWSIKNYKPLYFYVFYQAAYSFKAAIKVVIVGIPVGLMYFSVEINKHWLNYPQNNGYSNVLFLILRFSISPFTYVCHLNLKLHYTLPWESPILDISLVTKEVLGWFLSTLDSIISTFTSSNYFKNLLFLSLLFSYFIWPSHLVP